MKKDIENTKDITLLVDSFYEKVRLDELLLPVFSHVKWLEHLPKMYDFWSSMLLGDQSYKGNPFEKHQHLTVSSSHFERWIKLFTATIDENFSGTKAEETKSRASSIAAIFQHRMGINPAGN